MEESGKGQKTIKESFLVRTIDVE